MDGRIFCNEDTSQIIINGIIQIIGDTVFYLGTGCNRA